MAFGAKWGSEGEPPADPEAELLVADTVRASRELNAVLPTAPALALRNERRVARCRKVSMGFMTVTMYLALFRIARQPLLVYSSEPGDQLVVFGMRADPEPGDRVAFENSDNTIADAHACGVCWRIGMHLLEMSPGWRGLSRNSR